MSLSATLNTTRNIFYNTAAQSSVVSSNIQNASNPDYNKRSVTTTVDVVTGAVLLDTVRSEDRALLKESLNATSADSAQQRLLEGMESVGSLLGGTDYSLAPSAYLSNLRDTLQTYSETPGDVTLAQSVVNAAQDVATSLNTISSGVQALRTEADAEIAENVSTLNDLLADFEKANNAAKKATATGADPSNAEDKRNAIVKKIAEIIGVSTYERAGNDMVLYTSDGVTLFETAARKVSFTPTAAYDASSSGNAVYIDGVKLESGSGASTTAKGSIQALMQLRDDVLPTIQDQADEIARGAIALFAETDAGGNKVAGLFTTKSGTAVAFDTAAIIPGLASSITVNAAAVASPLKLRDGSIAGVSANTTNASGFSDVLQDYLTAFETPTTFDGDSKLATGVTLLNFSTDFVGWIEEFRSDATSAAETTSALQTRATEAYSNDTGVNLDEQLILLLDIEQSYKAASKLLSTVDEMLKALLAAAG